MNLDYSTLYSQLIALNFKYNNKGRRMRVATWVRTKHIKYNATWNDSINNIIYSVISSLTEFKTVLVLIFNPHLSAKLTPSPSLEGRTNNVHIQ